MALSIRTLLIAGAVLASTVTSQVVPGLTGTWTTKSRKVITGPVSTLQACLVNGYPVKEGAGVMKNFVQQTLISTGFLRSSEREDV